MKKFLCLILCALLLSGCGASKTSRSQEAYDSGAMSETMAAMNAAAPMAPNAGGNAQLQIPEDRKFIITMDVSSETDDLDAAVTAVAEALKGFGGYIENQNVYNGSAYSGRRYRSASLTLRIPADKLDAFTQQVASLSNVVSSSRSTEDVTLQYVDTESRIAVLKAEQTRLMELLSQAENMSDLLEIESRLTSVRADLESYTSQLRVLENQVDYATMELNLTEVKEYTPVEEKTRLQKIGEGFVRSLKDLGTGILDFFMWLIIDLPYLVVAAMVLFVLVKLWKHLRKKRPKAPRQKDET